MAATINNSGIAALEGLERVETIETPARLDYSFTAGRATSRFLRGLEHKKILGESCKATGKVYVPPRGADPVAGLPTEDQVEVKDSGIVTSFCVVNVQFYGQAMECPYVCALVLLDGADIAMFGLIQEIPYTDVRPGLRVEAVWVDDDKLGTTLENIKYFKPTGEADAPLESFKEHV
jgi:uncharacterized OB-fold protein